MYFNDMCSTVQLIQKSPQSISSASSQLLYLSRNIPRSEEVVLFQFIQCKYSNNYKDYKLYDKTVLLFKIQLFCILMIVRSLNATLLAQCKANRTFLFFSIFMSRSLWTSLRPEIIALTFNIKLVVFLETSFCGEMGLGVWLKHQRFAL